MKKYFLLAGLALLVLLASGCIQQPVCGNGTCETGETAGSCIVDCGDCETPTETGLQEMVQTIETVVSQKSPKEIDFKLSGCFEEEEEIINIMNWTEPTICEKRCGTPVDSCTVLEYARRYDPSHPIKIPIHYCLNIPPDTVFESQDSPDRCELKGGYTLQNLDEGIPVGYTYLLINKALPTDTFPTICAYRKIPEI